MESEPLNAKILAALVPLRQHANTELFRAPISTLIGAAACLCEARRLIQVPGLPRSYHGARVMDAIAASKYGAPLDWTADHDLRLWAVGFFMNSAQHRVAATLDKCSGIVLARKEGKTPGDPRVEDTWAVFIPKMRLEHVRSYWHDKGVPAEALIRVTRLVDALESWYDTEKASHRLRAVSEEAPRVRELAKLYASPTPEDEECAALACARTNIFKHRIPGLFDRFTIGYRNEWAITAKAFRCMATFCAEMIATKPLWWEQHSKAPS